MCALQTAKIIYEHSVCKYRLVSIAADHSKQSPRLTGSVGCFVHRVEQKQTEENRGKIRKVWLAGNLAISGAFR